MNLETALTPRQAEALALIRAGKVSERNTGHGSWRIFGAHPSIVGRLISLGFAKRGPSQDRERPIVAIDGAGE